jgi:hypothetical protein
MTNASRALLSFCVALYGLIAMANGLDRVSRRTPAVEKVVPRPLRAEADRAAASTALLRTQYPAALAHARAAVANDPVDIDSAALFGSALLVSGQDDAADKAFRVAARFGWRNAATQGYFYDAALQAGDLRVAADRADALLRTHPRLIDQQRLLEPLESDPAGRTILADHLMQQPPWLRDYLTLPADSSPELVDRRYLVVSQLAARKVSLGCAIAAPFANSLLKLDRWAEAKEFWNNNCPDRRLGGLVGDPTFAAVNADAGPVLPFTWYAERRGDVVIEREGAHGGDLRITNSASATLPVLIQPVAFPAGLYRLRVLPGAGQPQTGTLAATIGCHGKYPFPNKPNGNLLDEGQSLRIERCSQQHLSLWLSGGGSSVQLRSLVVQKIG